MPLDVKCEDWGVCFRFVACPTDTVKVLVNPLIPASEGCVVILMRGEGAKASVGALGPQVAALVKAAEAFLSQQH